MQGAEKILQHSSWDEIWIFRGALKLRTMNNQQFPGFVTRHLLYFHGTDTLFWQGGGVL